ncbi:diaminopimelate epimerase [Paraglaciecola aquimarina]|uniref:Diaminopimelate epimerase n=1 Tax=Paraglaciecola aquimarina TaxID=1235557 RepID=A0ABU3SX42_9ALTE|nr:diaminopimelate epimerase [Paraglaciecola aquimarina]MDU0354560.1 diaminopimelate epimerase [Paraglaciecola aquimarina]
MKFTKYHALGNDYIVIAPNELDHDMTSAEIKTICDRHYGVGSDGVLYGPLPSASCDFKLRIFNPDGSEAEKSGNGLRIFSRYLWDTKLVTHDTFSIETKGGEVKATVHAEGKRVTVDMGKVRYTHGSDHSLAIRKETIQIADQTFVGYRASVGNPHFVIPVQQLSADLAHQYGPLIEQDARFENRTNVQFLKVLDRHTIQIEIWERGAGYTLASGSSSTAAAGVACGLGLCDEIISVNMPGGEIKISLDQDLFATMQGAVCKIANGELAMEALEDYRNTF